MFAKVVFPLPFRNSFSYKIPDYLEKKAVVGVRAVCSFGKRVLTGFIISVSVKSEIEGKVKSIMDILDDIPIFDELDLKFYNWIAEYYISSLGEALRNAVPYGSDVQSKRTVIADMELCRVLLAKEHRLKTIKVELLKLLSEKDNYKISYLQKILKKKNIYSVLNLLEQQGAVTILNEIEEPKTRKKILKFVKLTKSKNKIYEQIPALESSAPKQVLLLLELLSSKNKSVQLSKLLKKTGTHQASVESLEKKNLIEIFDKEVERIYSSTFSEKLKEFELTNEQTEIINEVNPKINESVFSTYLLHGVTGSGKTQVYIELAKMAINNKKAVLILVPEISLTPQITSRFFNNFGEIVTVIHSRMSVGERYDSWRGIISGKYKVVIGARSALFATLKNIGLIVVDEEHDSSYKQFEQVPKYHARDAAIIRGSLVHCPVILGSATPSVESKYNAKTGKFKLLELKERADNAKLPEIKLVDITIEKKKKRMAHIFSTAMLETIADKLKKKEAIIILQNRRGFATPVFCEDCGEIVTCQDCSVPMVHHIYSNTVQCHYCGIINPVPRACPNCASLSLKFFGTGTQRVEDELEYHFPDAKIERVDSDTVGKKGKLGLILNDFRKGEIDILIGTQMVSKGLDFANVTLVGVVSAETTLWLPDFRSDERTFQLLTQVAGRAGRSEKKGVVLIQTTNHHHFVLQKVLTNDYLSFYNKEIKLREQSGYPPFSRLCLIEIKDKEVKNAKYAAKDFYNFLIKFNRKTIISPPTEAIIAKIKGFYRFQILIKSFRRVDPGGKLMRKTVMEAFVEFKQKSRYRNIRLIIDVDPQSVM